MPNLEREGYLGKSLYRTLAPYRIVRETSKYNKYMKWHLTFYHADEKTILSSGWFKTEREAKESVDRMEKRDPFPIGNSYQILEPKELEGGE